MFEVKWHGLNFSPYVLGDVISNILFTTHENHPFAKGLLKRSMLLSPHHINTLLLNFWAI